MYTRTGERLLSDGIYIPGVFFFFFFFFFWSFFMQFLTYL
jgi:hypothetical protein